MSRFREEMRIVPNAAWVIAVVAVLALGTMLFLLPFRTDPKMRTWGEWQQYLFVLGVGLPLFCYVLLIGYVNADARRRGMRYLMWTLLAALIPNAIGVVLYFILRDPLSRPCPNCGKLARQGFAFCPGCGTSLGKACPVCRSAVEAGWSHCARCGAALDAREPDRLPLHT